MTDEIAAAFIADEAVAEAASTGPGRVYEVVAISTTDEITATSTTDEVRIGGRGGGLGLPGGRGCGRRRR